MIFASLTSWSGVGASGGQSYHDLGFKLLPAARVTLVVSLYQCVSSMSIMLRHSV